MKLIIGKTIAQQINTATDKTVATLTRAGVAPSLAIVVPTESEATQWYVRSLKRSADKRGILCTVKEIFGATVDQITDTLKLLSTDQSVHGIICQTPLPDRVSLSEIGSSIAPEKDVDGANPLSMGRLFSGLQAFAPATARAVVETLVHEKVPLSGANIVMIGRSLTVGKPAASLLTEKNATVTICHSRTRNLPEICRKADILVAAVGKPNFVDADYVGANAVIIDVGTNPTSDGGLVGDVNRGAVEQLVSAITPVPGGVGMVTTAVLLSQVASAAMKLSDVAVD
ncbi:MAG: bifunctional 5,10-methylenetetrahydrofolate dehydrogenase/5,10-methenyltetrahydrofolate cyclohydrolase [Pseudomonadota bacterium]